MRILEYGVHGAESDNPYNEHCQSEAKYGFTLAFKIHCEKCNCTDLTAFCQDLKRTVRQWTGLPISIGIAETKTLAKIANRLAKTSAKTDGVLDLTGERWRDRALASTEVGDVWGIGRRNVKYAKGDQYPQIPKCQGQKEERERSGRQSSS